MTTNDALKPMSQPLEVRLQAPEDTLEARVLVYAAAVIVTMVVVYLTLVEGTGTL